MGWYIILFIVEVIFFGYMFLAKPPSGMAVDILGFLSAVVCAYSGCMDAGENDNAFMGLTVAMAFNVMVCIILKVSLLSQRIKTVAQPATPADGEDAAAE